MKILGRKLIEKNNLDIITFEKLGEEVIFNLEKIVPTTTTFGESKILQVLIYPSNEKKAIFVTSDLKNYNWESMIENYIAITFTGTEKTDKKLTYKKFKVEVLEVENV